ncbi:MAG: XRE family transcriptional regulator [Halobacteriovoraceae bacterium]|nr:XRE family transcriptional regulator [Halobacteriovoraceae bacterium]
MKYPKKKDITKVLNEITEEDFIHIIPKDATKIDKIKYELCKKFSAYLQKESISQAELARRLNVDRSRINYIVKYKIEYFTIDRLYELLEKIYPNCELKVS